MSRRRWVSTLHASTLHRRAWVQSSLRTANGLRSAGEPTGRGFSYAALGMWGGQVVVPELSPLLVAASYAAGTGQRVVNGAARRRLAGRLPSASLSVTPTDGGARLTLAGSF